VRIFKLAQVFEGRQRGEQGGGFAGGQFLDELRPSLGTGAAPTLDEVRPGGGQLDPYDALVGRVPPPQDEPLAFQSADKDSHRGLRHAFHPG
jgi:hypothetical protein